MGTARSLALCGAIAAMCLTSCGEPSPGKLDGGGAVDAGAPEECVADRELPGAAPPPAGPSMGCDALPELDPPLALPIRMPNSAGGVPTLADMFPAWDEPFEVSNPGFDSLNRAYFRERSRTALDNNLPEDSTGLVHREQLGTWSDADFGATLAEHFGQPRVCYTLAAGWRGAQVVFDAQDVAYTIVEAMGVPAGASCDAADRSACSHLLLYSRDRGATWDVLELPDADTYSLERPHSPESLREPPAILLYTRTGSYGMCLNPPNETWRGAYGPLSVVKAYFEGGRLRLTQPALLSSRAWGVSGHSGGGTDVLTKAGRIFATWGESLPINAASCGNPAQYHGNGSPIAAAELKRSGDVLEVVARNDLVARAFPTNDAHNIPALVAGHAGELHLIVGAHTNCPFQYLQSSAPFDVSNWTAPQSTAPSGGTPGTASACNDGSTAQQTYVGFVRDASGRLHLVYRHANPPGQSGGMYLSHQAKPDGQPWSAPTLLVAPPADAATDAYGIYYHKLTVDRAGRLFVLFSYFTNVDPMARWFDEGLRYKYGTSIYSDDGGASWAHVTLPALVRGRAWDPSSSGVGDLDGDGRQDLVHRFWREGLHLRASYSSSDATIGWDDRAHWFPDGTQTTREPFLVGDVDGDGRDDVVFLFRRHDSWWIRTKLSRDGGTFDNVDDAQPEGLDVALVGHIGDVDADGDADVILLVQEDGEANEITVRTKLSNGDGTWTTLPDGRLPEAEAASTHPVRTGDFDGDGDADLMFVDTTSTLVTRMYSSNGDGTWTPPVQQMHCDGDADLTELPYEVGDFDGDGVDDLVFFTITDEQMESRIKLAVGDGRFGNSKRTVHHGIRNTEVFRPLVAAVDESGCAALVFPYRPTCEVELTTRTFRTLCERGDVRWCEMAVAIHP